MSVDFGTRLIVAKRRIGYAKLTHQGEASEVRTSDGLVSLKVIKEHRRR